MQNIKNRFKCEYCGQEFTRDSFNIAVFLYGIFFLIGNESGYAGITCPNCLKTITHEGEKNQIEFLKESFSDFVDFGNKQFCFNLRYFSSVNYFPKNIQAHKSINILFWDTTLPTDFNTLHSAIYSCQDEILHKNHFCTYAFDDEPPMGSFLSIGWFKKDWIDDFIKIENETSLRIFPRYVPRNSVYEDIERFCWENHIYLNYLEEKEEKVKVGINKLKEIAKQNNIDFQEILDADPGIATPMIMEYMRNQFVDCARERTFRMPTDFMAILAADPSPADLPFQNNSPLISFWKTKHPFIEEEVPKSLIDFDFTQFEKPQRGPSHKEMVDVSTKNFNKESTQKFLSILSNRFIFDYIELAQKVDFSYGAVWGLKEKYLKLLYDSISSPRKRNVIINKVPEAELREVQKYKKLFPSVEIITLDPIMIQKIIEFSRLALLKKQYKEENIDFLLLGEKGVGKELFAKAINEVSGRSKNYICVNCAAIPENLFEAEVFGSKKGAYTGAEKNHTGLFEQADGGTVFLDEIGDLHINSQTKLLRFFQEREIQVLHGPQKKVDLIAVMATNKDLNEEVKNGKFRGDLLDRIDENIIEIPPLRKRKDDIPLLVHHFIKKNDKERKKNPDLPPIRITNDCLDKLKKNYWKGNVRDLEKVIRKIMRNRLFEKSRKKITPSDLPQHILMPVDPEKPSTKPQKVRKKKPSDEELIQFKKDGILQKEIAERYEKDPSTVSKWYKDLNR